MLFFFFLVFFFSLFLILSFLMLCFTPLFAPWSTRACFNRGKPGKVAMPGHGNHEPYPPAAVGELSILAVDVNHRTARCAHVDKRCILAVVASSWASLGNVDWSTANDRRKVPVRARRQDGKATARSARVGGGPFSTQMTNYSLFVVCTTGSGEIFHPFLVTTEHVGLHDN